MYFKAKDSTSREEKTELPLDPQHEGSEIDSPIIEDSKMEDVNPNPDMSKPVHLSA